MRKPTEIWLWQCFGFVRPNVAYKRETTVPARILGMKKPVDYTSTKEVSPQAFGNLGYGSSVLRCLQ